VKLDKSKVQSISNVENEHLQKILTVEAKKTIQLNCAFRKVEKYIKRFNRELPTLRAPHRQHVFSHNDICKIIFDKWEKYDKEVVREKNPCAPKV